MKNKNAALISILSFFVISFVFIVACHKDVRLQIWNHSGNDVYLIGIYVDGKSINEDVFIRIPSSVPGFMNKNLYGFRSFGNDFNLVIKVDSGSGARSDFSCNLVVETRVCVASVRLLENGSAKCFCDNDNIY